ncbi:hypothetical protein DQ137_04850 [Escherichia coli]|uniref:Uncharacterized protein n=4 Tax=Enterobacteriaceae TaxID=543 RepID=A0A236RRE0_ECOLX|nr:hypothetical protein BWL12_04550 [Escherichia coli]AQW72251.1 hypothetical protein B2H83_05240 [Escherichia coli M8]ARE48345.1 hypothetical protein B6N50_15535 [Escherichia coli C]ARR42648.1 hypothetical protein B9127_26610 [Shigella sonnei]ASF01364.1 hypothetical protein CEQ26_03025 [Escherichia coli O104:H4]AUF76423.1 hypothetical protein CGC46_11230 [Escherichia coli O121:H19]AUG15603.1 hypothetical protein CXP41_04545 [Escherichia coli str. K-12 substr. MG1655]AWJ25941.1 hypothetical 
MHHVFAASRKIKELQNWHDFFIYVNVTQGIVPWIEKRKCYEVCIKSFTGCTDPGFCGFFSCRG